MARSNGCKVVPAVQAEALAAQFPELTPGRARPPRGYVRLGTGGQIDATQWQLADEALRSCVTRRASRTSSVVESARAAGGGAQADRERGLVQAVPRCDQQP